MIFLFFTREGEKNERGEENSKKPFVDSIRKFMYCTREEESTQAAAFAANKLKRTRKQDSNPLPWYENRRERRERERESSNFTTSYRCNIRRGWLVEISLDGGAASFPKVSRFKAKGRAVKCENRVTTLNNFQPRGGDGKQWKIMAISKLEGKKKQEAENRMRTPCKNIQEDLGEIS